jgi:dimethylamine/trimethylamine dehydrogenase
MSNVEVYRESRMSAGDIAEFGFQHVAVATGATWRRDGVARWHTQPIPVDSGADVLTPDDLMAGRRPSGSRVLVYDDDHYYMGGVVAELLRSEGFEVEIVTPAAQVSAWTVNTMEVGKVQRRLLLAGVTLRTSAALTAVGAGKVTVANTYTGQLAEAAADNVVMVTARLPDEELYLELLARHKQGEIASVRAIGDAWAPGTIAAAVWSGRRFAEEFDAELPSNDVVPFRREVTQLHADPAPTGQ